MKLSLYYTEINTNEYHISNNVCVLTFYIVPILTIQVAYSNYSENMSQDINEGNTYILINLLQVET